MIDVTILTDELELEDDVVPTGSFSFELSDAFDLTEEEVLVDLNQPFDSVSVSDSILVQLELEALPSDSITISEELLTVTQSNRSPSDLISILDLAVAERTQVVDIELSDTVDATDVYTLTEKSFPEDEIDVSDSVLRATDTQHFLAVVVDVSDILETETSSIRDLSDTVDVTDSVEAIPVLEREVGDNLAVTDTLAHTTQYARVTADAVILFESLIVDSFKSFDLVLSDTVDATDTVLAESINVDVEVSDSIEILDVLGRTVQSARTFNETLTVTDLVSAQKGGVVDRDASDSIFVVDAFEFKLFPGVVEDAIHIADSAIVEILGEFQVIFDSDGLGFVVPLPYETSLSELSLSNFTFTSLSGGVPFQAQSVTPVTEVVQTGSYGFVESAGLEFSPVFRASGRSPVSTATVTGSEVSILDVASVSDQFAVNVIGPNVVNYLSGFTAFDDGRYLVIHNGLTPGRYLIKEVIDSDRLILDKPLPCIDVENGQLQWSITTGATALRFEISNKITNNRYYRFNSVSLKTVEGVGFNPSGDFYVQGVAQPRLVAVESDLEGTLTVEFDQPMRVDADLVDLHEYSVTGPTLIRIQRIWPLSDRSVAIETQGLTDASYTLWVNYAGTPKDEGANPLDPAYSSLTFAAFLPERPRSIFTDKGPIAKPELLLQSGYGITLHSANELTLIGGAFNNTHLGKYLRVGPLGVAPTTSSSSSAGDVEVTEAVSVTDWLAIDTGDGVSFQALEGYFRILSVVSATRVKVQASITLPNPSAASTYWQLVDPRNGQIADSPSDVTVSVNGTQIAPTAVRGLLGQVLLPTIPTGDDDVKVSYSWCSNPTVEVRGLNSSEFRLNTWNRNTRPLLSQHTYRYNNVLVTPSHALGSGSHALLRQPKLRELHYRGYERAYTPVLNDPTTLVLNSPVHRIAYPSTSRTLEEEFVTYEADTLPENSDPVWIRKGVGATSVSGSSLRVVDNVSGPFPYGQPLFWTQAVDLTYPHLFAFSWRFKVDEVSVLDGIWTGLAVGYSDQENAFVLGFLEVGGVKKVGFLKKDQESPGDLEAWTGGLDVAGAPTGQPVDLDWSFIRSYRLLKDSSGRVRFFVDGNVVETLRITPAEAPSLADLNSPFDEIQGTFFGSLSRTSSSISQWDFVRYTIIPTNPIQVSPSIYVNYEGLERPEEDNQPWTPVGSYGAETLLSGHLLLDSTSAATDNSSESLGLIGGYYRGFFRLEPLLTSASQVVLEADVAMRSHTHGIDPDGLILAVNDGTRLMQVAFLADKAAPRISYGGGSLPEDFDPYVWDSMGSAPAILAGRILRITDASTSNGRVYFFEDAFPVGSNSRVVSSSTDYILEFRVKVSSYTADGSGFAGAFAQVFDGARSLGVLLADIAGVKSLVLHSEGVFLTSFAFDWGAEYHTYRIVKNTAGDLVTLFAEGTYVGSLAYSAFTLSSGTAFVSFGSSTPSSSAALSVVDWDYCNAWRLLPDLKRFVGMWKGYDPNSLTGYHLPTKATGNAQIVGNTLQDSLADFNTVVTGDPIVVDYGLNKGVYEVASIVNSTTLTIVGTWPLNPSEVEYRVIAQTDWTSTAKYRLFKDSSGQVLLFRNSDTDPLIQVSYNAIDLPDNSVGVLNTISGGLPSIVFGSFSPGHLEQSVWDYVRYGIARSLTELKIVPHHQVLNQWNVMESPERLYTAIPHDLTSFKSSSTGIAPKKDPALDLLENPALTAFTLLNEDTPLMPKTQAFEARRPYPVKYPIAGINSINNVLNSVGSFTLNNGESQFKLVVPDNVLYSSLEVIEQSSGEMSLIAPADDDSAFTFKGLQYQKEVCLSYDGSALPESVVSPTPWVLESEIPAEVLATALSGVLTYRTVGSTTVYKNNTPLPDAIGLITEVKFRMRLAADASLGTSDTQVRFGVSAPGMTVALAFVTTPQLERLVLVMDLKANRSLGAFSHDFLDGNYHTYRVLRDPSAGVVRVSIDS